MMMMMMMMREIFLTASKSVDVGFYGGVTQRLSAVSSICTVSHWCLLYCARWKGCPVFCRTAVQDS